MYNIVSCKLQVHNDDDIICLLLLLLLVWLFWVSVVFLHPVNSKSVRSQLMCVCVRLCFSRSFVFDQATFILFGLLCHFHSRLFLASNFEFANTARVLITINLSLLRFKPNVKMFNNQQPTNKQKNKKRYQSDSGEIPIVCLL